jgi:hypothetical protein
MFECHVTLEPIIQGQALAQEREARLEDLATKSNFKIATLLMRDGTRSRDNSFCSAKNIDYNYLIEDMISFLCDLKKEGYKVYRYKIEQILLDVKIK